MYTEGASIFQNGSAYVHKYEENVKKMEDILTKSIELVQNLAKNEDHIFKITQVRLEGKIDSAKNKNQMSKKMSAKRK